MRKTILLPKLQNRWASLCPRLHHADQALYFVLNHPTLLYILERFFNKMITAQRPSIYFSISFERKVCAVHYDAIFDTEKPRFIGYRLRSFWENVQKNCLRCLTNKEVKITTEGYYSYHLHTTFKETRP